MNKLGICKISLNISTLRTTLFIIHSAKFQIDTNLNRHVEDRVQDDAKKLTFDCCNDVVNDYLQEIWNKDMAILKDQRDHGDLSANGRINILNSWFMEMHSNACCQEMAEEMFIRVKRRRRYYSIKHWFSALKKRLTRSKN